VLTHRAADTKLHVTFDRDIHPVHVASGEVQVDV
jgi:hypothetical protein